MKPVIEILAKSPLRHRFLEAHVRGCDEAHVDGDRGARADAHDLVLLEHAKELHLRREREISDLVQEERPAVRRLEPPRLPGERSGERSLLVSEELTLHERRRERAAVHRDEGGTRAR